MSETTASLRRKIASARELQSVVRTMKALAASNIGQYQRSVAALADYYRTVELGLAACVRHTRPTEFMGVGQGKAEGGIIGAVVFGSDQGLVGRFNDEIAEHAAEAMARLPGTPQVWAVGERVQARLADAGVPLAGAFAVPTSVQAIAPVVGSILLHSQAAQDGAGVSQLHLFYNQSSRGAAYAPVSQRLLPLDEDWRRHLTQLPWPTRNPPELVAGSTAALRALIGEYLFVSVFRACAESLASENASRRAAMERADRNIGELLETQQGNFQRLRQSGIDEELFDVISGFEAMSSSTANSPQRARPHD